MLAGLLLEHAEDSEGDSDLSPALQEYARLRVPHSRKMAAVADWAGRMSLGDTWYWRWLRDFSSTRLPVGRDYKR